MHGEQAAERAEMNEVTEYFVGQVERVTHGTDAASFNARIRDLQHQLSRRVSDHARAEVQQDIDLLVVARAEEIIRQRDEVARKAGQMQAARRARQEFVHSVVTAAL